MVESSETSLSIEPKPRIENKQYEVDGRRIGVIVKEFSPSKEISPDGAVIFLPGWSAGTAKTLDQLNQRFAEDSGGKSYSITTRPEQVIPDSLYQEARAIQKFIEEKGLKKIILGGHSEGASKAADLIDILQRENPDIDVEGLIALDPVGLYKQGRSELVANFAVDSMVKTPMTLVGENLRHRVIRVKRAFREPSGMTIKNALVPRPITKDVFLGTKRAISASLDIVGNMPKQLAPPNRLSNQIEEMAEENPRYREIKCPVVLVQGAGDMVSSPGRVIPDKEDRKSWSVRRRVLKETIFPNSSDVSMLVAQKYPRHGLPHFRPEQIVKVALYQLNRHKGSSVVEAQR